MSRCLPLTAGTALLLGVLLAPGSGPAWAADDAPADEAGPVITRMPSVAEWVEAPFPDAATEAGITEARVVVRIATDASGLVLDAQVQSEDPPDLGFGTAALDAVFQMRFNPAMTADGPIPATFDFTYGFSVEEVVEEVTEPAPITLEGLVRELGTREPVSDALITITPAEPQDGAERPPLERVTRDDGSFDVRELPPGRWRVTVRGPVHLPQTDTVEVVEGEVTSVTLWARPDSTSPNEVVVFGQRERPPEITRRTLTTQEIRRIPGTFGDPVKVIQTLPGAARSPFGTGLLIIRGANPEDSGVYVDGIRVPLIYHLTGTTSVLAPDLVESVDYLPGGYAGRFGRTMAGTIDVRTRQSIDETRLSAGADVLDAQAYFQTNVPVGKDGEKKLGVAVGARRSYVDVFLPYFLDGSAFSISPRYYDYQVKLFAPTPVGRNLTLFVYGFDDTLTISSPDDRAQGSDQDTQGAIGTRYNSHRVIAQWEERLADGLTFRMTPSVGVDTTSFGVGDTFALDGKTTLIQGRASLEWEASEVLKVTPGVDLLTGPWSYDFRSPLRIEDFDDPLGERDPIAFGGNGWVTQPDVWLRFDLTPLEDPDDLIIVPSLRLNTFRFTYAEGLGGAQQPFGGMGLDPRVSGRMRLGKGVSIKASTGLYHQPPQPQESIGIGTTPDLGYERAWNSSVGVEHEINPSIQWEAELFWRDMTRLIDTADGFTGSGTQPFANVGFGRAYGMELIARHQPTGRFFGWVSYTLSRSERRRSKQDPWTAFDFDQTHIVSAQAGYDLPYDTGVSFQVQYVTGNPDTPLDAGVYDVDTGDYNGFRVGRTNSQRLPAFFQTSLRFDKTFLFKSWELDAYVDLLNMVRGVNPEFTIYNYDFSEYAYVRGLPFIPNVGIEARIRR